MIIKEMSEYDIRDMIRNTHVGRLAYILDQRPVVIPMGFRFSGGSLYSFTTEGQKTEALRKNNAVCVLFDHIHSLTDWRSVVVHGRFHEVTRDEDREAVTKLMDAQPSWWEPGYVRTVTKEGEDRKLRPVYFRIDIEDVSGHQAA